MAKKPRRKPKRPTFWGRVVVKGWTMQTTQRKQILATVVSADARGDEPSIVISTSALDRDRDEIVPEGGDFGPYLRNPVVQYGHDSSSLPVGSTTRLEVVPGQGIRASWRWLENDPFADRVRNAFDQGVLRAASIGFLPLASEPNGQGGLRYTRWQLAEWSLVNVPANPEAVRVLRGLGLLGDGQEIIRLDDEPLVAKRGRVISAANEELIREAMSHIGTGHDHVKGVAADPACSDTHRKKLGQAGGSFRTATKRLRDVLASIDDGDAPAIDVADDEDVGTPAEIAAAFRQLDDLGGDLSIRRHHIAGHEETGLTYADARAALVDAMGALHADAHEIIQKVTDATIRRMRGKVD